MDYKIRSQRRTGLEKFIDHLVKIANDSLGRKDPYLSAGKRMAHDARAKRQLPIMGDNYKADSQWTDKDADISGVHPRLTRYEQKGEVYQHILAHTATSLYGIGLTGNPNRSPVQTEGEGRAHMLHNSGIINPTTHDTAGKIIGRVASEIAESKDRWKRDYDKDKYKKREAITEIEDNKAARKVSDQFIRRFRGEIGRDRFRRNLHNILGTQGDNR